MSPDLTHSGAGPSPAGERPGAAWPDAMRRLKWLAVVATLGFVFLLELVLRQAFPFLLDWSGRLLVDGATLILALVLLAAMFAVIEKTHSGLERQNRELLALHTAALDIYAELSLETVLQRVVDQARLLLEARYGAVSVIDERNLILEFVTSGIDEQRRARIGRPPEGRGLLGVVLHEGHRLRLTDLARDPRAVGFPLNHPPMHSLLAAPILCNGPFRGNLYLAEKLTGEGFSGEDEQTLVRFATKAAIAIDHAHLHRRLNALAVAEERLRIAHEMHDGLAQVLAYVNAKAQAVREYLRSGRSAEAAEQLEQLAAAARDVYTDVREDIIGLRNRAGPGCPLAEALAEYVAAWGGQSGVACQLSVDPGLRLPLNSEFQVLRIVQEALANVRKHAHARQVEVKLEQNGGTAVITIGDDGVGFNPAELGRSEFPRFGLATMRERAESIGASVRLESPVSGGSRVVVEVPLPAASHEELPAREGRP
ncbi:MAG TPA: GAF domain-containing sensor histidine kinase [Thermoanaerobaculia bacterium]|nr:GAF domain-containing sensor histidine kinase [Thermoanaerobaculia bacterium]